jgi:hypothetical protein
MDSRTSARPHKIDVLNTFDDLIDRWRKRNLSIEFARQTCQQNGHVPGCHARQNGLLASQRASQAVIAMSWSSRLLIAASIRRSRDRRRQIPIKAIQPLSCCTMLSILSFNWALNTPPCRISVQLVAAYEQTATRCFGKDRIVMRQRG